ncbi:unnamed protein product [Cuscuta campestris]|uniref:Alpha/beta hydrolase fold-3 domain-containing protein n=1 Tax=Cuscuta campestris TaxID=132261 RepID=A0A484L0W5_9ASTE|nr:unnamed protein product [Cuscuta campestris]
MVFGLQLIVEPWLASHADHPRCVVLGVSCGANVANYFRRYTISSRKHLDQVSSPFLPVLHRHHPNIFLMIRMRSMSLCHP